MSLAADDRLRYSRQIALPAVGEAGQARLAASRVLVVGAGGLGSAAALYLAAAGVGTLGIVDDDVVDLSNLHRQLLHDTAAIGRHKVLSARERIHAVNPGVRVEAHAVRLDARTAAPLVAAYDLVIDGSDNFATRYVVSDACVATGRPDVHGSATRLDGQAAVLSVGDAPCYRCLFPEPPPAELGPGCDEAGVLGMVPGIIGTIQATEAIKLLLGFGESLAGRLLLLDAQAMRFTEIAVGRDPACPACGKPARRG